MSVDLNLNPQQPGIPKLHPLVLAGVAKFLGSFSTIWASSCPPQAILEIIAYLSTVSSVPAATEIAGNSIRLVLISSANKLARVTITSPNANLAPALVQTMEAALNTNNPLVMRHVAEGRCGCGLRTAKQFTNLRMSKPATLRGGEGFDCTALDSENEGDNHRDCRPVH